jgi:membrane-associated phospholipid phosphatase
MPASHAAWALFTRLGEAQILLPAMAAALLWLLRTPATRPLAGAWLLGTAIATVLTTASKVAFMGWLVGSAPLDYTGISGHAMFAAAVLPVLARMAAGRAPKPWPRAAIAAGLLLAAAVALSRVATQAHSPTESVLGFALGSAASLWALRRSAAPEAPTPAWFAAALLAWMLALPFGAPPSRSHDWVTQLSLRASGRSLPYTRLDLRRQAVSGRTVLAPAAQVQVQPVGQRQLAGHGVR